jgi:probable addiction module antidote protein
MAKRKTLKKRIISIENYQERQLKTQEGVDLTPYNPGAVMRDKAHIAKALIECIVENDMEAFKEILSGHMRVINKDELAKKTGISKRTLFRMVSPEGNPTLENASKVIHELCA